MYLKEVQGFRVVAALLVAVYHIWFHRVSGGVDAFFVIAGFFLVQGFLRHEQAGFARVLRYWQRTLARIVPSAALVILVTVVLFALAGTGIDATTRTESALASLVFVENWRLAASGSDYLSIGQTPSPFQQMWALSVQMQLYLVLPLVIFGLMRLLRRAGRPGVLGPALMALLALAFAYALFATWRNQPAAYFDTFARMWEFLAGGALAVLAPRLRMGRGAARVLGHVALVVLAGFAAIVPVANSFPGAAALIPVLATCAIIAAARNGGDIRVLNNAVMQRLGDLSFTFYLWHWPVYLFIWDRTGSPEVSLAVGIAILLAALALAAATHALFEAPFRALGVVQGAFAPALLACVVALVPTALFSGGWYVAHRLAIGAHFDALELDADMLPLDRIVPAPPVARYDLPASYRDGCHQDDLRSADLVTCDYGNAGGSAKVVLVGGSHSLQWLPGLQAVAARMPDLSITNMTKSGCAFTLSVAGMGLGATERSCLAWNRAAIARITEMQPDLVVTMGTRIMAGEELVPDGYRHAWARLGDLPVLAIRENPRAPFDIAECVDRRGPDAPACAVPRRLLRAGGLAPSEFPANVTLLDFTDRFCTATTCPPVRDNILLYRDAHHLTATATKVLYPRLATAIGKALAGPGN